MIDLSDNFTTMQLGKMWISNDPESMRRLPYDLLWALDHPRMEEYEEDKVVSVFGVHPPNRVIGFTHTGTVAFGDPRAIRSSWIEGKAGGVYSALAGCGPSDFVTLCSAKTPHGGWIIVGANVDVIGRFIVSLVENHDGGKSVENLT